MGFTVERLHPALGAAVKGLDLREKPDAATVEAVLAAFHEHIVLVFRDQELTEEEQKRFALNFGPLGVRKRKAENRPEGPDSDHVMLITNIRENGIPIGSLPDGEMLFHHDMCYVEAPDMATMLYAIEPTRDGGHTLFANMYAAYDKLRPETRALIEGRQVLQIYQYDPLIPADPSAGIDNFDHLWQPAIVVHPATGRKALYVNQLMTMKIEGLDDDEARPVLKELWALNADPELVYEHVWEKGDLVMWDNLCSTHARTDFPDDQTRLMRRCTVAGEKLVAAN